jgi:hypothetical protein
MDCGHGCCAIPRNGYHVHQLVASVVARVAPEIPGLPAEPELTALVSARTLAVAVAARGDRSLVGMSERERHVTLCGRVGLALAFGAR